jgi:hypothetical protein
VIDLSKCTELVNGWPILYGPTRTKEDPTYPWNALVREPTGFWEIYSFNDDGFWHESNIEPELNLKLPDPEWVYLEPTPDGGLTPTPSIYAATHRYRDGDQSTMEAVKDD